MKKINTIFNWSTLDRPFLIKLFEKLSPIVVNKEFEIKELHQIFRKHIKTHLPVKITKNFGSDIKKDSAHIGGVYYCSLDKQKKPCIEVKFVYNNDTSTIKITKHNFQKMSRIFADTILHELLHMKQYRKRKFKVLPDYASTANNREKRQEQQYLGCLDEMDAYGFNIACELSDRYKNDIEKVIEHLNNPRKYQKNGTGSWNMYLKAFDNDHQHPIICCVKIKVLKYLPNAIMVGKPYRSKNWISP